MNRGPTFSSRNHCRTPSMSLLGVRPFFAVTIVLAGTATAWAEPPVASYIFPAGAQRGTTASFKVGGLYLNDACAFDLEGPGVTASKRIARTKTIWFEGPPMARPASNLAESYPQDFAGTVQVEATAPLGTRYWRVSTSQGTTPLKKFVVGEFPKLSNTKSTATRSRRPSACRSPSTGESFRGRMWTYGRSRQPPETS